MELQPLPAGAPDQPATPLTSALAPGSLTSYGPGSVRLPTAAPVVSGAWIALLGWLVPGLGQMATGRRRAGLALLLVILTLFAGGLALTDFSCIDPHEHRLEFVAHALIGGPTALTVVLTEGRRSSAPPRWRDLGSLYVIVAGFLNLIAVCSAVGDAARRNDELRRKHQESVGLALAVARLQALARRPLEDVGPNEPEALPEGGAAAEEPPLAGPSSAEAPISGVGAWPAPPAPAASVPPAPPGPLDVPALPAAPEHPAATEEHGARTPPPGGGSA